MSIGVSPCTVTSRLAIGSTDSVIPHDVGWPWERRHRQALHGRAMAAKPAFGKAHHDKPRSARTPGGGE